MFVVFERIVVEVEVEGWLSGTYQAPGLSVGKATTTQPWPGRNVTSRRGGLLYVNFWGSVCLLKTPVPVPRMKN